MNRLLVIGITCAALFTGWIAIDLTGHREPRYQGRSLTQWLDLYQAACVPNTSVKDPWATRQMCRQAVGTMGGDAIPFLLKMLQARDSALRIKVRSWLDSQSLVHFHLNDQLEQENLGALGLDFLGTAARPAVPALVKLTKSDDQTIRFQTYTCLVHLHPDLQVLRPVVLDLMRDPNPIIRTAAAADFRLYFPEEAARTFSPALAAETDGIQPNNASNHSQ